MRLMVMSLPLSGRLMGLSSHPLADLFLAICPNEWSSDANICDVGNTYDTNNY